MSVLDGNGWRETTLGQVINVFDHLRVPLSTKQRRKRQGDYPYYGASGIIDYIDHYIFDGRYLLISEDGANLVTRNTPIAFFASGRFWVNNHAHIVRGCEGVADDYFLLSYIEHADISGYITGTAQPKLSQANLKSIGIRLPPLDVQRRIAGILSAYDDLIENNTRRIAILEEMAQAIYREWFVNFRFPGHEQLEMVGSELGPVPTGWEVRQVRDEITLSYGKALKSDDRREGSIPVYGSSGVIGYHDEGLVPGPGIVVGRKGNVGSVHWCDTDFYSIDTTYYVETRLDLCYVYFNLQQQNFLNNDAAVPGLNRNQAYLLPLLVPSHQILSRFTGVVEPIFAQLRSLQRRNKSLRQTRDLLLPRLISGEIELAAAEGGHAGASA